jgi:hypothetical protein
MIGEQEFWQLHESPGGHTGQWQVAAYAGLAPTATAKTAAAEMAKTKAAFPRMRMEEDPFWGEAPRSSEATMLAGLMSLPYKNAWQERAGHVLGACNGPGRGT